MEDTKTSNKDRRSKTAYVQKEEDKSLSEIQETTTQAPVTTLPPVTTTPAPLTFEQRLDKLEGGDIDAKQIRDVLSEYVKVSTESMDLAVLGQQQMRLWSVYRYIHVRPAKFSTLYSILVEFAREHKETLFSPTYLFRAQAQLSLDRDTLQCFTNLRTLLANTVSTTNKTHLKGLIDIGKIVANDAIPEAVKSSYVAYYQ